MTGNRTCCRCGRQIAEQETVATARWLCDRCEAGMAFYVPAAVTLCGRCAGVAENVVRCAACGARSAAGAAGPGAPPGGTRRCCWSCGLDLVNWTHCDCPYCGADTCAAFPFQGSCPQCGRPACEPYSFCPDCGYSYRTPCLELRLEALSCVGRGATGLALRVTDLLPAEVTREWDRTVVHVEASSPALHGNLVSEAAELPAAGRTDLRVRATVVRGGFQEVNLVFECARLAGDRPRERRRLFGRACLWFEAEGADEPARVWYRVPLFASSALGRSALKIDGFAPGVRLGRFVVDGTLAARMASGVYSAHDEDTGEPAVLKVVRREERDRLGSPDVLSAIAAAPHPNVVRVLEAGALGAFAYLALEAVAGGGDFVSAWPELLRLPAAAKVALVAGVLEGLGHLHGLGIVHRDVKPANLLRGDDGRGRILDFGISFRTGGRAAPHRAGGFVGTPRFASPEQVAGEALDARTDLFSLGLVLVDLLTGRDVAREAGRVDPEDLARACAEFPDLAPIFRRLLAQGRDGRYPSAAAALADLRRCL